MRAVEFSGPEARGNEHTENCRTGCLVSLRIMQPPSIDRGLEKIRECLGASLFPHNKGWEVGHVKNGIGGMGYSESRRFTPPFVGLRADFELRRNPPRAGRYPLLLLIPIPSNLCNSELINSVESLSECVWAACNIFPWRLWGVVLLA